MSVLNGIAAIVLCSALLLSCTGDQHKGELPMGDESLRQDLLLLQNQRIYFGHQSVGVNVIEGVKDYLTEFNDIHLNMISLKDSIQLPESFFADSFVGQNSKPDSKCDAFASIIKESLADRLDIALMKFCYVDIRGFTDVEAVFRYYRTTMDSLKSRYPRIQFVHVTVPLAWRSAEWKRVIKIILGLENKSIAEAEKRNAFNVMLTEHYRNEPVFDLAKVESTRPDGSRSSMTKDGKTLYVLANEYTDDGGHLNAVGRKVAARELIRILAGLVRQRTTLAGETSTEGRLQHD